MKKKYQVLLVFLTAIIFTFLFHRQDLGLNLLILETALFAYFVLSKDFRFKGKTAITVGLGLLVTALFTVLTYSLFAYAMHFIALFIYLGVLIYPEAKSILNSIALSFINLGESQARFVKALSSSNVKGIRIGRFLWRSRIFTIPLIVIILFVFIYGRANPVFGKIVDDVGEFLQVRILSIFKDFDALVILTFLVGLVISNLFFLRFSSPLIVEADLNSTDTLTRQKTLVHRSFKMTGLKNEYKAGVFLLIVLNAILLLLNVIDVNWVWFNFEWEAQDLKQFVHEGTYLLILSILISVAVVLFFFRGNLNFFAQNKLLKYLSYIWIAQNGILTISVAIRNFYYIHHFSLAYKRIGVIIFLLLTVYGLYTVFAKVRQRKSTFYLLKSNAYSIYIVLVLSSAINWDSVIAQYNFRHVDKSFLHLEYLSTLSDKALPYLDKPLPELILMDKIQDEAFPFAENYMAPEMYHRIIEARKKSFIEKWERKNILSWNLPEYLAYRKLKDSQ